MGLVWSDYRKVKNDTVLLTKAVVTAEIKDDVWLLWTALKGTPDFAKLKKDGFGLGKDNFDGNRWKVLWFYDIKPDSFDEDKKGTPKWRRERDQMIQKWIIKLASIKDALADENSDESSSDHADAYNVGEESSESEEKPKKAPPKATRKAPVKVSKQESVSDEDESVEEAPAPKLIVKKAPPKAKKKAAVRKAKTNE